MRLTRSRLAPQTSDLAQSVLASGPREIPTVRALAAASVVRLHNRMRCARNSPPQTEPARARALASL